MEVTHKKYKPSSSTQMEYTYTGKKGLLNHTKMKINKVSERKTFKTAQLCFITLT